MDKPTNVYTWSPWIGCHRKSQGCKLCSSSHFFPSYFEKILIDENNLTFPLKVNSIGEYLIPSKSIIALEYLGDFFIEDMDPLRSSIWDIIRARKDCTFILTTKRPERILDCLPSDWKQGWSNIHIECTCQNQKKADERLPIFLSLPLKNYTIAVAPILQEIDLSKYLDNQKIEQVFISGEFIGKPEEITQVTPCNYKWVKKIASQCQKAKIPFLFSMTGTKWINENNQLQLISPSGWDMKNKATSYNLNTISKNNYNNYFKIISLDDILCEQNKKDKKDK